jgi:hypothetical protein
MELVTPTGAALLGALARFEQPAMVVTSAGAGAGKRDLPWPNILRLIVGSSDQPTDRQTMVLLETNIDDMNPQVYGHVMARLFEAGALDVSMTPVYMKKNRPGIVLGVIARQADELRLAKLMLAETSTLGIRVQPMRRYEADRVVRTASTPYGEIPLKLKILDGQVVQAAPEYEVCARLATEHKVSFHAVYSAALQAGAAFVDQPERAARAPA